MLNKILITAGLLLLTSLAMAAETLRVGMSADYPPLHFKQDGRYLGIEADNAKAVGEILSRRVEIVEIPLEQLLPALRAGKVDVLMSGLSVTAERSAQVQFTDSYLRVGQMAIMHKSKIGSYSQPWAVYREGVRIGVKRGSTGADFAERELQGAQVRQFENTQEAFAALRGDVIDLYIHDAPTSWQLANSMDNDDLISLYAPLTEEMLAWAVRKEDGALAAELNRALQLMRGNGTLQYILNRWIPVTVEVH
ncbi:transporter substrate-binding domain-containing protein [Seongchinamella unica]|uniref:Transporter substrate-binding domain-containing protein n=1 Tax=Seongchinamella unica TaxID=2547392 RepID=A0A4R5LT24_9GAMM|nr:transporter substrate-binding domain-containing protein [Seongchinamella unica]TDG14083.1 transporter substrate-binding domain-containing protein [Seongchinamella unica]